MLNLRSRLARLAPVFVFLAAASVAAALILHADQHNRAEARARVAYLAIEYAADLQRSIEHNLYPTYALAALVRQGRGTVRDFDAITAQMLPFYPGISEIALAPKGVIRQVAPLAGNERAVGFDLMSDSVQRREAYLARDTGKLTLAGPLNLVQGGVGVVGRLPVLFDETTERPQFWGFTLVVIRISDLLKVSNLSRLTDQGLAYTLWRANPETGKKQIIAASTDTALAEPVEQAFRVPNANWTLSLAPPEGWGHSPAFYIGGALGLAISLLLAYLARVLVDLRMHRAGLESLVVARTAELGEKESRYRELFEGNPQPMWVFDLDSLRFIEVNDAAIAHYGYSREEFLGMNMFDIRPAEEVERLKQRIEQVRRKDVREAGLWKHCKKDGSVIDVEITAHTLHTGGRRAQVVHINDVTWRLAAERELRANQQRFQSLAAMSSDWYWESDADHRLTRRESRSSDKSLSELSREIWFGQRRWDIPCLSPDAAGWQAHIAALEEHRPFRNFEFSRLGEDGQAHYFSISGDPVFDAAGAFAGYLGMGNEITERKRAEHLLRLEHAVAARIAGAEDAPAAIRDILRAICESEGWGFGLCWRVDEAGGVLRFDEYWCLDDEGLRQYAEATRKVTFAPGVGMVGHVWLSGQPLWVPDTARDARVKQRIIQETGLRSLFGFPLVAEEKVIGVLAFLSREAREPEERLLVAVQMLGSQIGQFLRRKQSELALRESEARYHALTDLSADWYWEQDEQQRITRLSTSSSATRPQDVGTERLLGRTRRETPEVGYDPHQLAALERIFAAHEEFRDFDLDRSYHGAAVRHVQLSGMPIFAADGRFAGYRGIGKDVTAQRQRDADLQRFLAAMDASVDGIYVVDRASLRFIHVSESACAMLDLTREAVFAAGPAGVLGMPREELARIYDAVIAAAIAAEVVAPVEMLRERRDGRRKWIEIRRAARRFGDSWTIVTVARDITERKRAEKALRESEHRYRAMFDSAPEGVWMIGPDRRTTEVNQRMCDLLGLAREDMLGRDPVEFADAASRGVFEANAQRAPTRQTRTYDVALRHRDGHSVPAEFDATDLFNADGSLMAVLAFVVDRTERRRHEEELRRLNEELEQRVARRTQALEAANRELEAFSYSVSHDLRAPLRAINGFTHILEVDYAHVLDQQGRAMLQRVSTGAQKMGELIEDLLRLARYSQQEMHLREVNLSALAEEAAGDLGGAEPARQVQWVIAPQLLAQGDPGLLRVVMQNLIGNAWKYSARRGDACIEFGATRCEGRTAYFVRDNGAGFDMEYAGKLFGPFQRLHTNAEFPGSGIGLATVARILHRHGGSVWGEGRVGAGATFFFTLGEEPRAD